MTLRAVADPTRICATLRSPHGRAPRPSPTPSDRPDRAEQEQPDRCRAAADRGQIGQPQHGPSHGGERGKARDGNPAHPAADDEQTGLKEQQIEHQHPRPGSFAADPERGEETAEQSENRDQLTVAHRHHDRGRRGHRHPQTTDEWREQAVKPGSGKQGRVEHGDTGGCQSLGDARRATSQPLGRAEQAHAEAETEHDASSGPDQSLVDRVLDQKRAGQRERDGSEPHGAACSEQSLEAPAGGRSRGLPRRRRSVRRRRCGDPRRLEGRRRGRQGGFRGSQRRLRRRGLDTRGRFGSDSLGRPDRLTRQLVQTLSQRADFAGERVESASQLVRAETQLRLPVALHQRQDEGGDRQEKDQTDE